MAAEIKQAFAEKVGQVDIQEAELVGTFDVYLQGELVYSKKKTGRLPHPGEVELILLTRID